MTNNTQNVQSLVDEAQTMSADDPDLMEKLNEIALKVAQAQGKTTNNTNSSVSVEADPMDELGCEGCQ